MPISDPFGIRRPEMTAPEAAQSAGIDLELVRRLWRGLGLPDVDDDEVFFDPDDVESLTALREVLDLGVSEEDLVTLARVYGESLARIADAQTRVFKKRILDPMASTRDSGELVDEIRTVVPPLLELVRAPLFNSLTRHQSIAMQRLIVADDPSRSDGKRMCAGFVDLVDFSRFAEDLSGGDLSELVSDFEVVTIEVCAALDVRLVKVLGDAAMFVSSDPRAALRAAEDIVTKVTGSDVLPEARAGLDLGEVVPLGGDYFGHPVNVAARVTAFARPGTVVVTKHVVDSVGGLDLGRIGIRRLKGVGNVSLFKVRF